MYRRIDRCRLDDFDLFWRGKRFFNRWWRRCFFDNGIGGRGDYGLSQLAIFEEYIDTFRVTEANLIAYGLTENPLFGAFVAAEHSSGRLLGMAVHYVVPWTYDMRPDLVLKELFVIKDVRGLGIGAARPASSRTPNAFASSAYSELLRIRYGKARPALLICVTGYGSFLFSSALH